jgi:hypothetical protein
MDTWAWLAIIAAIAIALVAVAWWSSGRARARSRGPETSLTQEQVERTNQFQSGNRQTRSGY